MSGARWTALLALALALALALGGCGGGEDGGEVVWLDALPRTESGIEAVDAGATWLDLLELETRGAEPDVADAEVRGEELEESGRREMERTRRGDRRIVSDRRRAFVLDEPGRFELEVPAAGTLRLAFGLPTAAASSSSGAVRAVRAAFEVELDTGGGWVSLARALLSNAEAPAWRDVRAAVPGPGRLRFSAARRDDSDPLSRASFAFAAPSLELSPSAAPDVVLISVDTLRADRLGLAGYGRDTSPHLDRLAGRGVVFERCVSQAPWTLPAYGSLFTSLHPTEHRAGIAREADVWFAGGDASELSQGAERLITGVPTLAEVLRDAGYRTAAVYFNPYLSPSTGLARGFDEYVWAQYGAKAGVDLAVEWLDRNEGLPRFLLLQLIDPHWPYAPPAPFDRRFAGLSVEEIPRYPWSLGRTRTRPAEAVRELLSDLYDGEVAYVDAELGRLFDYLERARRLDDALVVLHSDHGEELFDHGRLEHGHSMHDELLRVPLVVARPSVLAPGRVASTVRTIDVFPTVLDLLGLAPPEGLRGSSLLPFARGELGPEVELRAFAESILWGRPYAPYDEAKTLVGDGFKVVVGDGDAGTELFDLEADPGERTDLAGERADVADRLRGELERLHAELRGQAGRAGALELDAGALDRLHKLGYAEDE